MIFTKVTGQNRTADICVKRVILKLYNSVSVAHHHEQLRPVLDITLPYCCRFTSKIFKLYQK